jgi:hypothetical protein
VRQPQQQAHGAGGETGRAEPVAQLFAEPGSGLEISLDLELASYICLAEAKLGRWYQHGAQRGGSCQDKYEFGRAPTGRVTHAAVPETNGKGASLDRPEQVSQDLPVPGNQVAGGVR